MKNTDKVDQFCDKDVRMLIQYMEAEFPDERDLDLVELYFISALMARQGVSREDNATIFEKYFQNGVEDTKTPSISYLHKGVDK